MKLAYPNNPQKAFAFALIVLQAVALALFFETFVFSTIIIVVALFAMMKNARTFPEWLSSRLPLIFPLAFVVQRTIFSDLWSTSKNNFLVPDGSLVAAYFMLYQLAMFFVKFEKSRLPSYLPILAITGLIFTGDVQVDGNGRLTFQIVSLLLVLGCIGFYMAGREGSTSVKRTSTNGHRWWLLAIGSLCCVTTWACATGLHRYSRQIESALNLLANPSVRPDTVGFSGAGRIGSVAKQKGNEGKRVAIRVFSKESPGYLRGKVFDTYSRSQWQRQSKTVAYVPIDPAHTKDTKQLEVWPAQFFREVLFTPLNTTNVEAPVEKLSIDRHGVIAAEKMPASTPYKVWHATSDQEATVRSDKLGTDDQELLTTLPANIDPQIGQLATAIIGDAVITRDKIVAVESFFLEHFEYQFGIDVPADGDPIEYFLLNRPPAHCEFFASGAVMLLRSVGVPCRYVAGFVAVEKNKIGDYWVARNRDAHAWAEAFDPERGWVIVEATPAGGIPQSNVASKTSQSIDTVRSWWQRLMESIRSGSAVAAIVSVLKWMMYPVAFIGGGFFAVRLWKRKYGSRSKRTKTIDPTMERLQTLLQRMDEHWRRDGITRMDHETLDQFANRLRSSESGSDRAEAATWYQRFSATRYSGRVDGNLIEQLADDQRRSCQAGSP